MQAFSERLAQLEKDMTFHEAIILNLTSRIAELMFNRSIGRGLIQLQTARIADLEANPKATSSLPWMTIMQMGTVTNEPNTSLHGDSESLAKLEAEIKTLRYKATYQSSRNLCQINNQTKTLHFSKRPDLYSWWISWVNKCQFSIRT